MKVKYYDLGDIAVEKEINLTLRHGNAIVMYMDKGSIGMGGQTVANTSPHEAIVVFESYNHAKQSLANNKMWQNGKRVDIRMVVIGEGCGVMTLCDMRGCDAS